jgi:glycosyltransferase involved in cell wall biosynthesis
VRVAIVTGGRSAVALGLETAELRLLSALRERRNGIALDLRVVGGRSARAYAARLGASWYPSAPNRGSPLAWRSADLVHLAGLTLPPPRRRPFVAMFHDLSPLHFDDEGVLPPWAQETADRARLVLTPSRFIAGELERDLGVEPERIRVVPNGPGHAPAAPFTGGELATLGIRGPFVLRTGGYTARKNVGLLLAAWPEVRRRTGLSLVLAGPPQRARERLLLAAPSLDGVLVLDFLPAETVQRLVASAAVVVSPSVYEGFGLPPLEALAAGRPVVAVRTPFAEEVCGDAAVLVENDPAGLAAGIVAALDDPAPGPTCRARADAFSWERAADEALAAYRAALG